MSKTISIWLRESERKLKDAGVETARLDCLVLLGDELGTDKSWLLAHPEYDLPVKQLEILHTKIAQRAQHIPLSYIRGKTEFYGREFVVNEHVLEPRPESETMIEMLKHRVANLGSQVTIVDIGTGSGALAITAKLELPKANVVGVDIDPSCLQIASQNAQKLGAEIAFLHGNLLQPLATLDSIPGPLMLLCNLPYVPTDFHINRAATHEPTLALFGGEDGLDLYRTLFEQTKTTGTKPTFILAESLPPQHKTLADIATAAGYLLETTDDFIQLFMLN